MHLQKDCTRCKGDKKIPTPNGVTGTKNTKKKRKSKCSDGYHKGKYIETQSILAANFRTII